jgi:hypothetical protein
VLVAVLAVAGSAAAVSEALHRAVIPPEGA